MSDLLEENLTTVQLTTELLKRLKKQTATLEKQVEGFENTLTVRRSDLKKVDAQIEDARSVVKQVLTRQQEVEATRTQIIAETGAIKQQSEADVNAAKVELQEVNDTIDQAKTDHTLIINNFDARVGDKRSQLTNLEDSSKKLQETIKFQNDTIVTLEETIESIKKRQAKVIESYETAIKDKQGQVNDLDDKLSALKQETNTFKAAQQQKINEQ